MRDATMMYSSGMPLFLYNEARKWFPLTSLTLLPILLLINAPFGRFTPQNQRSPFLIDGITSWIAMELVAPLTFLSTYLASPLTAAAPPLPAWHSRHAALALCFVGHYVNRALVSPLRTPSRSKAHVVVPLSGVAFNLINGALMGAYLSSPYARIFVSMRSAWLFYAGLALWAVGFVGNVWHDEILLNIRRKAKTKGKGRAEAGEGEREHYAIPHGGLYTLVSYPNYLFEWIEWLGFALAAAPLPLTLPELSVAALSATVSEVLNPQTYVDVVRQPAHLFAPDLAPPWIFLISEVLLMLPRAYRGHQWYRAKFREAYPRRRKVVIPFVF
ncbi:hypothetical protein B0H34DRAFT_797341 [Crassisporium funariophilum]|nr:hypothetical protein B0H34DRAFT_797341 [Crassisporium funariophilum]